MLKYTEYKEKVLNALRENQNYEWNGSAPSPYHPILFVFLGKFCDEYKSEYKAFVENFKQNYSNYRTLTYIHIGIESEEFYENARNKDGNTEGDERLLRSINELLNYNVLANLEDSQNGSKVDVYIVWDLAVVGSLSQFKYLEQRIEHILTTVQKNQHATLQYKSVLFANPQDHLTVTDDIYELLVSNKNNPLWKSGAVLLENIRTSGKTLSKKYFYDALEKIVLLSSDIRANTFSVLPSIFNHSFCTLSMVRRDKYNEDTILLATEEVVNLFGECLVDNSIFPDKCYVESLVEIVRPEIEEKIEKVLPLLPFEQRGLVDRVHDMDFEEVNRITFNTWSKVIESTTDTVSSNINTVKKKIDDTMTLGSWRNNEFGSDISQQTLSSIKLLNTSIKNVLQGYVSSCNEVYQIFKKYMHDKREVINQLENIINDLKDICVGKKVGSSNDLSYDTKLAIRNKLYEKVKKSHLSEDHLDTVVEIVREAIGEIIARQSLLSVGKGNSLSKDMLLPTLNNMSEANKNKMFRKNLTSFGKGIVFVKQGSDFENLLKIQGAFQNYFNNGTEDYLEGIYIYEIDDFILMRGEETND